MKLFNIKGSLFITISSFSFAMNGIFYKQLAAYDIFYQTYVKSIIIVLVLLAFGIYSKAFKKISKEDIRSYAIVLGFTIFTVAPATYAYRYLELGTVSFLFYASLTIFSYIFGALFFSEKFGFIKIISLILSVIGMVLVFTIKLPEGLLLPVIMCIINGLAASGETVFSKNISNKYSSTQITLLIYASIAITHLLLSLLLGENQNIGLLTFDLHWVLLFCTFSIIGVITVIRGFQSLEPSIAAVIGLSEILFSLILGILLFNDPVNMHVLLGGLMIVIAATLPNLYDLYKLKRNQTCPY